MVCQKTSRDVDGELKSPMVSIVEKRIRTWLIPVSFLGLQIVALQLGLVEEDSGGSSAELVAAIEAWDFEDKHVTHDLALELDDEVSSSLGRAA